MDSSTNIVLYLLIAAQECAVNFTMADIDCLSRKVLHICKVAPNTQKYHMEDVHCAGGVLAILGKLDRASLMNCDVNNILSMKLPETLNKNNIILT